MGIFSGDWEIDVDFIGGSARHGACLNQQGSTISGRYRSQYGEHEIGGRAEGEEIDMSVDIQYRGVGATYRFTGRSISESTGRRAGRAAGSEPQCRRRRQLTPARPGRS